MGVNRHAVGALAVSASLLVGGGTALAAPGQTDRGTRCEAFIAKIAERRGVSVEQLQAEVKARLIAGIDAAEKAGRISKEQAAKLRERIAAAKPCAPFTQAPRAPRTKPIGMFGAAATFLRLDRAELRAQLPGTSLAALATKQGKRPADLEAAMVAPAKTRLDRAVADEKLTRAQANRILAGLEKLAHRLATKVFRSR
jgi:hypothetical protein